MQDKEIISRYKEITSKNSCAIEIIKGKNPDILDNKIGGKPYLPLEVEYPLDSSGNPMLLLLQVNLKDVKLNNFPMCGILEIFTTQELTYPSECKIFLFPEGEEYQESFLDINTEKFIVESPKAIRLYEIIEYMPISNYKTDCSHA